MSDSTSTSDSDSLSGSISLSGSTSLSTSDSLSDSKSLSSSQSMSGSESTSTSVERFAVKPTSNSQFDSMRTSVHQKATQCLQVIRLASVDQIQRVHHFQHLTNERKRISFNIDKFK